VDRLSDCAPSLAWDVALHCISRWLFRI
jgi:hypothetical protein